MLNTNNVKVLANVKSEYDKAIKEIVRLTDEHIRKILASDGDCYGLEISGVANTYGLDGYSEKYNEIIRKIGELDKALGGWAISNKLLKEVAEEYSKLGLETKFDYLSHYEFRDTTSYGVRIILTKIEDNNIDKLNKTQYTTLKADEVAEMITQRRVREVVSKYAEVVDKAIVDLAVTSDTFHINIPQLNVIKVDNEVMDIVIDKLTEHYKELGLNVERKGAEIEFTI